MKYNDSIPEWIPTQSELAKLKSMLFKYSDDNPSYAR